MLHMLEVLRRRLTGEEGQTVAEYSLVLTLITIGCISSIAALASSEVGALMRVAGLIP